MDGAAPAAMNNSPDPLSNTIWPFGNTATEPTTPDRMRSEGKENSVHGSGSGGFSHQSTDGIPPVPNIGLMPDHLHLLIGLKPAQSISDLVRDVKAASSGFINEQKWIMGKFNWQEGFGAFSYAKGQIDNVARYIQNQVEHHREKNFKEEYLNYSEHTYKMFPLVW